MMQPDVFNWNMQPDCAVLMCASFPLSCDHASCYPWKCTLSFQEEIRKWAWPTYWGTTGSGSHLGNALLYDRGTWYTRPPDPMTPPRSNRKWPITWERCILWSLNGLFLDLYRYLLRYWTQLCSCSQSSWVTNSNQTCSKHGVSKHRWWI